MLLREEYRSVIDVLRKESRCAACLPPWCGLFSYGAPHDSARSQAELHKVADVMTAVPFFQGMPVGTLSLRAQPCATPQHRVVRTAETVEEICKLVTRERFRPGQVILSYVAWTHQPRRV